VRAFYNDTDGYSADWLELLIAAGELPAGIVDRRRIEDVGAEDVAGFAACHFFAGIGGWPLALRLAGWPDDERPIWTGSCPCQPYSSAGKRLGDRDERDLWPAWLRLIAECRPPVVFGEQVASAEVVGSKLEAAFVVAVQAGDYARANKLAKRLARSRGFHYWARWVDRVRRDLEGEGYTVGFTVLGAHSVGAPHLRQRLFWVAHAESNGRDQGRAESDGRDAGAGRDAVGLGNAEHPRPQGGDRPRGMEAGGAGAAVVQAGPWDDYAVVHCRDNRSRRVPVPESGVFPLAYGIPRDLGYLLARLEGMGQSAADARRILAAARRNRVGRLRGYGNAIVPQLAAEFVSAYLLTRE